MLSPVGVEKLLQRGGYSPGFFRGCSFFDLVPTGELGGCSEGGTRGLAEEAHQSFDVLGSRRQEELLTNELHPA